MADWTQTSALSFFTDCGLTLEDNWEDWEELCELFGVDPD